MYEKIQALIGSWGNEAITIDTQNSQPATSIILSAQSPSLSGSETSMADNNTASQLRDMLIRTVNLVLIPSLTEVPTGHKNAQELLQELRDGTQPLSNKSRAALYVVHDRN